MALTFGKYFTKAELRALITDNGSTVDFNATGAITLGSSGQTNQVDHFCRALVTCGPYLTHNGAYLYCPIKLLNGYPVSLDITGLNAGSDFVSEDIQLFIAHNLTDLQESDIAGFIPKSNVELTDTCSNAFTKLDESTTPSYVVDTSYTVGTYFFLFEVTSTSGGAQGVSNNTYEYDYSQWRAIPFICNTYGDYTLRLIANSWDENTQAPLADNIVTSQVLTSTGSVNFETISDLDESYIDWTLSFDDDDNVVNNLNDLVTLLDDTPIPPTPPTPTDLEERVEVLETDVAVIQQSTLAITRRIIDLERRVTVLENSPTYNNGNYISI